MALLPVLGCLRPQPGPSKAVQSHRILVQEKPQKKAADGSHLSAPEAGVRLRCPTSEAVAGQEGDQDPFSAVSPAQCLWPH